MHARSRRARKKSTDYPRWPTRRRRGGGPRGRARPVLFSFSSSLRAHFSFAHSPGAAVSFEGGGGGTCAERGDGVEVEEPMQASECVSFLLFSFPPLLLPNAHLWSRRRRRGLPLPLPHVRQGKGCERNRRTPTVGSGRSSWSPSSACPRPRTLSGGGGGAFPLLEMRWASPILSPPSSLPPFAPSHSRLGRRRRRARRNGETGMPGMPTGRARTHCHLAEGVSHREGEDAQRRPRRREES